MELKYRGNFEFVKEIFPEIYDRLHGAECQALINYRVSGDELRQVLEGYCRRLLREYRISMEEKENLSGKLRTLRMEGKLPRFERYKYQTWSGAEIKDYWDAVWRKFGNSCHHPELDEDEDEDKMAAISYDNLMTVFEIVFRVFRWEYERKKGKKAANALEAFSIDRIPIGENYVLHAEEPVDMKVTHCIREYETCSFDDSGRVDKYGIVRVFNKNDMDEKALALRDKEAFKEAADEAGIQFDGNVQVDVISRMNSSDTDYYIIIYKFSRKPVRLNQSFLAGLGRPERAELCRSIARILGKFHGLSTPIYHRNLSYDSIYICQNKKGLLEPSIIKLDCAKIVSDEFGTVIETVQEREKNSKQKTLSKYVASEVQYLFQGQDVKVDWAKADVYSLGVLFGDILRGSFEGDLASSIKLKRSGADTRIVDLIDRMLLKKPELRPSMEEVLAVLEAVG